MECSCGIPSKANWSVTAVLTRTVPGGTETTDVHMFWCDEHVEGKRAALQALPDYDVSDVESVELR